MTDEDPKTTTVSGPQDFGRTLQAGTQQEGRLPVKGVSIFGFSAESRAQQAGMNKGDVITSYDNQGDLSTEKLASLAAETRHPEGSVRVVFVRDGIEHSVELQPGSLGIRAMDVILPGSVESQFAEHGVERVVRRIQNVYLALALLGFLVVLGKLAGATGDVRVLAGVPLIIAFVIAYLLLRTRSDGAITPVLILSAYESVIFFGRFLYPAVDFKDLIQKILCFAPFLFWAYQILFFCRPSVRALFNEKGTLVY